VQTADLLNESQVDALLERVVPTHLLAFRLDRGPRGVFGRVRIIFAGWPRVSVCCAGFARSGGVRVVMAGSCVEYDWSKGGVCEERSSPMARRRDALESLCNREDRANKRVWRSLQGRSICRRLGGVSFFSTAPTSIRTALVPSVVRHLLANQEALCTATGVKIRSFLHVADVGAAFASVLDSEIQGPVNIGSDEKIALADLIARIARQIGRPDLIRLGARSTPTEEPPFIGARYSSPARRSAMAATVTLSAGLTDTIAWCAAIYPRRAARESFAWMASPGRAFSPRAHSWSRHL